MATTNETVFSEFFLDAVGVKPAGATETTVVECVGSLKEEMETKTITKKCRGRVKKSRAKGSGGKVTIAGHFPYALLRAIYGMEAFSSGVYGYGTTSQHKECLLTAKVKDEDDNVQYRAYPAAVATTKSTEIDDDNDEVPMAEIEFSITPDDNEQLVYQALEEDTDATITDAWMSGFTTDLIATTA